jgi:hypothetical protein
MPHEWAREFRRLALDWETASASHTKLFGEDKIFSIYKNVARILRETACLYEELASQPFLAQDI